MSTASQDPRQHPDAVLFPEGSPAPALPCVDHYAGSEKLMRKAIALQAELGPVFDITLDCEDGAAVGDEIAHADLVAGFINSPDNRFNRIGARIHDVAHAHWQSDIDQIIGQAGQRIAFITLPKARGVGDVRQTLAALRGAEQKFSIGRQIPLHALIETHGALQDVWQIAALPGVASLDFGIMDFVSAHHGAIPAAAMRSPGQFDHPLLRRAKCEVSAAALANGLTPTHNVCTEFIDTAMVAADARRAREEFAFLRMWSIHPRQIPAIVAAMQTSAKEIAEAGEIICAAQDSNWGPIRVGDRLHDRGSFRYYWSVLKRAQAAGCELPADLSKRFFATEPRAQ